MLFVGVLSCVLLFQIHCWSVAADVRLLSLADRGTLADYRSTLILFIHPSCRFSRQVQPIFSKASEEFEDEPERSLVLFGSVDCEVHEAFCDDEKIDKYPTIRVFRYGRAMKAEYRGPRAADTIIDFVRNELKNDYLIHDAEQQTIASMLEKFSVERNTVYGIFPANYKSDLHYHYFKIAAHIERDNCAFAAIHNVQDEGSFLIYKDALTNSVQLVSRLNRTELNDIHQWIISTCTPIVRELTFDNSEEIISELRPLLILFYNESSQASRIKFQDMVRTFFTRDRDFVNFVTANASTFSYALDQLGKTEEDLPMICIDSLSHIYVHPKTPTEIFGNPNYIRDFLNDLYSGELHYQFHKKEMLDAVVRLPEDIKKALEAQMKSAAGKSTEEIPETTTTEPAISVFKKLGPSRLKYTIKHEEL